MTKTLVQPDHLWVPSVPNSSSSTSDGMCNTSLTISLKLPKFLSLNEFHCWSQKPNSKNLANPPYALQVHPWINLHTPYFLHSFSFLWTYFCIGTPCYLSNWLMWYDWMKGTMLFLAKYLGFLFKKLKKWLASSNYKFLPGPKLDFHDQTLICSLTLLWVLSNSLTLVRDLSYSHDQDHVHVHSYAILVTP